MKLQESQGKCLLDSLPPRQECLPAFLHWLDENNVEHGSLKLEEIPGKGWGIVTTKDFNMGELILTVPSDVIMMASDAWKSPLGKIQMPEILRVFHDMPHVLLALHLMNELLTEDSKWRPYIELLPRSYSLPLYFTPDDMKCLTGSPSLSECINQVRTIGSLYTNLFRLLRSCPGIEDLQLPIVKEGFKYKEFCWAVSTVMSRQNKILAEVGSKMHTPALIPVWDFCNHSNGEITTEYDPSNKCCQCFSQSSFKSGEEILIFYGPRPNVDLLCYSGFVYPDNQHDALNVRLGLSSSEDKSISEMRKMILTLVEVPCAGQFHLQLNPEPFSGNILAFVRVFVADEQELRELSSKREAELKLMLTAPNRLVSEANEMRTYDFLATRCSLLLRPYQTSIEDDDKLLADVSLSRESRQAVLLQRCEKAILNLARETAVERSRTLQTSLPKV